MKKILGIIIILILFGTSVGCSNNNHQQKEYPVKIINTDIEKQPLTVVSLSPSLTEITYDLGFEIVLDGVSDYCTEPKKTKDLVKVGTAQNPDFDAIKKIKPDIIITSTPLINDVMVKLEQMDIKVIEFPVAKTIDEVFDLYNSLGEMYSGKVTGKQRTIEAYSSIKQQLESTKNTITKDIEKNNEKSAVFVATPNYNIATGDTLFNNVFEYFSINNVAKEYKDWIYTKQEKEKFTPDILFYNDEMEKNTIEEDDFYKNTNAVKTKNIYKINMDSFLRQGFNSFKIMIDMAQIVYPKK